VAIPAKGAAHQMQGGRNRSASAHLTSIPANVKISNFDNERNPLERGLHPASEKFSDPYTPGAPTLHRSGPHVSPGRHGADG
jgi:hypothetical protein